MSVLQKTMIGFGKPILVFRPVLVRDKRTQVQYHEHHSFRFPFVRSGIEAPLSDDILRYSSGHPSISFPNNRITSMTVERTAELRNSPIFCHLGRGI